MTREQRGRGATPRPLATYPLDSRQRNGATRKVATARAHAGPPVPGRTMWLISVLGCPCCGAMHVHRSGDADRLLAGRLVRSCPTTGQPYALRPVQRRREAVRRAS